MTCKKKALLTLGTIVILMSVSAEKTKLHVITHSHLDAGWVKDVDTCYLTVLAIFNSVLASLDENPSRKYTVGDLYFFERWFKTALTDVNRDLVRKLVKNG
jgi:alpha-mannosidase